MASMVESQEGKDVSEKAAEMAKEEAQPSRKRARRAHIEIQTPGTLPQYRDAKKYLSVTDFVSPLWCEYAFHYGILGLRHLPVSQRPKEIETPSGHILRPDKQVAQQREKVLVGGRKVHEKLEKEIHPVKVRVQTTTREDEWALRILRLITGLKTLLDSGCCREVPIFGFVHGELVMGVVDEINRRPLTKRLNKYLDEAQKEAQAPASKTLSDFFTPLQQQDGPSSQITVSDGTKKYSSQEEWKKEMRRKEALSKGPKKSPKKSLGTHKKGTETGQGNLMAFFGGKKDAHADTTINADEAEQPKERYGYFLEDSKTRLARLLPPVQDQKPARLQCMLYKRLFDGLLSGMIGGRPAQPSTKEGEILELDEYATPFDLAHLFAHQSLDAQLPLSDAFILDAEGLLNEFNLSILASDQVCTLKTIAALLSETLSELAKSAQEGMRWKAADFTASGVIQHHLRLTYRKRKGKFHPKSKYASEARRKQPSRSSKRLNGSNGEQEAAPAETESKSENAEDRVVAIALELGVDDDVRQAEIEDEVLRDNGVVIPDSSPSVPLSQRRETDDTEPEATPSDKNILGTVDFYHNPIQLDNHLHDMMLLWKGERSMRGVTIEQSWRCHKCEFRQDCEWRQEKGQEELDKAMQRRLDQAALQIDQQPIGASDSDGTNSNDEEQLREQQIVQDNESQSSTQPTHPLPQKIFREDLDDEDALWSQFEEIETEQLKD
ncbi:uncharacterized protein FA14DRAFT_178449 [Meira miltonrushii]|uniref:Exonuclease V n=1 Tax=Meira miltonrushii TaxID=1280837 RepID=A0A316VDA1_9BASI|nr:uncharacterized protein FA14DRAFT_178449 [Meira miltonrushii]PWN35068.1 hypothetical protein FA14DRAFT_178449 [Meira miltonrushii]